MPKSADTVHLDITLKRDEAAQFRNMARRSGLTQRELLKKLMNNQKISSPPRSNISELLDKLNCLSLFSGTLEMMNYEYVLSEAEIYKKDREKAWRYIDQIMKKVF